jgi:hypothetical protein
MSAHILRCLALIFGLVFGLAIGVDHAEAGKLPIPCTGERIMKVMTLPQKPEFTTRTGQHIDLGYLYQGCSSGKWIGYTGSSSQYVTFKDGMLPAVLAAAGIAAMPSEPSLLAGLFGAPTQFWGEWLWIVIIGCIAFVTLFSSQTAEPAGPATQAAGAVGAAPQQRAAPPAGYRAARTAEPAPTKVPVIDRSTQRPAGPAPAARVPRVLGGVRPSPGGFGRRG